MGLGNHATDMCSNWFCRCSLRPLGAAVEAAPVRGAVGAAISLRKVLSCYLEQVIGVVAGSHATDMGSNWFCTCSLRPLGSAVEAGKMWGVDLECPSVAVD